MRLKAYEGETVIRTVRDIDRILGVSVDYSTGKIRIALVKTDIFGEFLEILCDWFTLMKEGK